MFRRLSGNQAALHHLFTPKGLGHGIVHALVLAESGVRCLHPELI